VALDYRDKRIFAATSSATSLIIELEEDDEDGPEPEEIWELQIGGACAKVEIRAIVYSDDGEVFIVGSHEQIGGKMSNVVIVFNRETIGDGYTTDSFSDGGNDD